MFRKINLWFTKSKRASSNDDYETWKRGGVIPTLNRMDNNGETYATVLMVIPIEDAREIEKHQNGTGIGEDGAPAYTLDTMQSPAIASDRMVRRLTPTECERLQGFPDGWTAEQADSNRYKQLGNAVAVPVVEWIVKRMVTNNE